MADELEEKRRRTDLVQMVTCQAPVNIAVIKYCKKRESMLKTLFVHVIFNLFVFYRGKTRRRTYFTTEFLSQCYFRNR